MTIQQIVLMARIMNHMENLSKTDSNCVKDPDGAYHYYDSTGREIITAKMETK